MPTEALYILIFGIFFFIALLIRAVWLAVKTQEKAFWYLSIGPLMFILAIVSILGGNFIGFFIMMFLMMPYVIVMLLKYTKKIILAQKELSLKGFNPREAMKISDYFSLFLTMKGWLKVAERRGKEQTLIIFSVFTLLIFLILNIGGFYALPNIFTLSNSISNTVIGFIIAVYYMRTYLENNLPKNNVDHKETPKENQ